MKTKKITRSPSGEGAFVLKLTERLKVLQPHHIVQMDKALDRVGPFGQVRLIINRGQLRFIEEFDIEDLPEEP